MTANSRETPGTPPVPRPSTGVHRLIWNLPLGGQLSALYTLLLALTLTLVGILAYTQQDSFLVQDAAGRLESAAQRIVARPTFLDNGREQPGGGGRGPAGGDPYRLLENLIRGLSGPDVTVAILDQAGTVLTATQGLTGASPPVVEPVSAATLATTLTTGQPARWVARRSDGSRQVVVLLPLSLHFGGPGAGATTTLLVEQSASLAAADAALNRLGLVLLLGVLGGTGAGVVGGLAFTRAVLRPLDRVAHTAEAIAAGDLGRRLELPAGRNEVARLGHAFDHMVGQLVALVEAQRRFVADASHELRTPLTSLRGLTEILMIGAHGDDPQVIEGSARAIHDELNRLSRLVNDLLTLSRLDSTGEGGLPTRRRRMDAAVPLAAAAAQMGTLAEARSVHLTASLPAPLWLDGDAGQVKQVVLNLLDNALRYTPPGGLVELTGTTGPEGVQITVRDTGEGIAAADLPHIFDRFYRGDPSRTRSTGNSGLGLAIAQAIMTAHGGQISVQSTPGVGTCFTLLLPAAAPPPPPDPPLLPDAPVRKDTPEPSGSVEV